eukprot:s824_g19.t1
MSLSGPLGPLMLSAAGRPVRPVEPVKWARGELLAVQEESEVEDLRDQMMLKGIPVHYPAGAVAGGLLSALAVGIADSLLELGGAVAVPALEVEGQSFFEKKPPNEVVAEEAVA